MTGTLSGAAAIAGIGATEFSKDSGRSELRLAAEAVTAAVADAGLTPADVDGLVSFTMDTNAEIAVARAAGIGDLTYFSRIHYGGGAACSTVQQAAMAVATGVADVVVAYRAFNERSGRRFGQVDSSVANQENSSGTDNAFSYPHGLSTPAAFVAMIAQRYMHEYGAVSADFGRIAVTARTHAANNPNAFFYGKPITLDDHQSSRYIAEPLHLLDCCQESDGGVAIVVVSAERAKDLPHKPVTIAAAASGSADNQFIMTSYYREQLAALPEMGLVGDQLWRQSGLGPSDMDAAILYDHFTPYTCCSSRNSGSAGAVRQRISCDNPVRWRWAGRCR
jgi:acetyl-CoA acetyltransferase